MNRILNIFVIGSLFLMGTALAENEQKNSSADRVEKHPAEQTISKPAQPAPQPVRIDISKPAYRNNVGFSNPNQPASQPASKSNYHPSVGVPGSFNSATIHQTNKLHWNKELLERVNPGSFISASPGGNVTHHHHPFTQGYVRKKLQKLGVSTLPNFITDRQQILVADKDHSVIRFPHKGPDKQPLAATLLPVKGVNNSIVSNHMNTIHNDVMMHQISQLNLSETQSGHYYWHTGDGFNFCHFIDPWGYQWYGWYLGDNYFWTRYYQDRWWFYDSDNDRWCFWDNGFWWWQDPYHVADLYFYNDGQYIPADSAQDPVVTTTQSGNLSVYSSPDGTRLVKVMTDSGDAFLFDASIPPSFNPIYLASQVTGVKFSDVSNGQPLEIMLTFADGSFDLYDSQGAPLNYGDTDAQPTPDAQGN